MLECCFEDIFGAERAYLMAVWSLELWERRLREDVAS